jgi:hypothetical protein
LFGLLADTAGGGSSTLIASSSGLVARRQAELLASKVRVGRHQPDIKKGIPAPAQPATRSITVLPTQSNAIPMTGTATAFSLVVGSFCVVALYVLIINIYKPYKKTLDASRTQENEDDDDNAPIVAGMESGGTTSASTLPPIMLTTFHSRTLEDLSTAHDDKNAAGQRVEALRAELKGGGTQVKEPERALLRKMKTSPT